MSDNIDKNEEITDPEAQDRADKIKAIRSAIHSADEQPAAPENPAADSEWENDIAARIARKVQKVKENKSSEAADILRELDGAAENAGSAEEAAEEAVELAGTEAAEAAEYISGGEAADAEAEEAAAETESAAEELSAEAEPEENTEPADEEPIPLPQLVRAEHEPETAETPAHAAPVQERADAPQPPKKKSGKKKKKKKKKTFGQKMRSLFPEKGDSALECIRKLVFLGSLVAIIVCGYLVSDYYVDLWRSRMMYNEIADLYDTYPVIRSTDDEENDPEYRQYKVWNLLDGAKKLLDINPDIIGYMTIPTVDGDPIVQLPVVKAQDNKKYLTLNFKGEESRAGALFLDWRNHFDWVEDHHLMDENSDNLIVYGHNMADESMFGSLKYYQWNADYYESHPIIEFNSNYDTYTYQIFAFFIVDAADDTDTKFDCWNRLNFNTEEEFYDFVNEAKKRSLRNTNVNVKYGDELLTLSTCNKTLDDRGRLIVLARQVPAGSDPYEGTTGSTANENIKWPNLYYEMNPNAKRYDPNAPFEPYGPSGSDTEE